MNKRKDKINPAGKEPRDKKRRVKKEVMIRDLIRTFHETPKNQYNYRQLSKLIGVDNQVQKLQIASILNSLKEDGVILEVKPGKFQYNSLGTVCTGVFHRRSNGKNTFIPEDGGDPIRVAERNSKHAMDGDLVRVELFARRKGIEQEAEVLEVLSSKKTTFVGTLKVAKGLAFLITEDKTLSNDIFIPRDHLNGGKEKDKAIVRILEWPENAKNPLGEVIDILGVSGQNNTEMHAILAEYGLPYRYPEEVEKAAEKIPTTITKKDRAEREDFRKTTTFTIDPKDAKDFDDAISVRRKKSGTWEIGVHIADVTRYVKPEDIIDKEAYERATSVYLVDRTVPMLPEKLCNNLCSLRPNEEKLCFAVVFEMDNKATILQTRICRTIINSDKRFTYEEAQQIIEEEKGEYCEELLLLNGFAQTLRKARFAHGAIEFDRYEVKFEIDSEGKPLGVYYKESKEANKLVEEFMLLANKSVAEAIGKRRKGTRAKTFVYRVHDLPDSDKIASFSSFASRFGYKIKLEGGRSEITKGINKLLNSAKGKPEENLIETLAIRSMQKARYSTENIGHYGLAFDYYTHFTSPIRRYPDMMVHRLLERYLGGGNSVPIELYEEKCTHCSQMEIIAANAERASIKYKQVEFMKDKLGQIFDGVISGVTEWGFYVELNENKCEGLVAMRHLDDDFYEFDDKNYRLIGKRHKRIYQLGDQVTVKVAQANLERKQLDFELTH